MNDAFDTTITQTSYGTVSYERGLEVAEIGGMIEVSAPFVFVYVDPDLPLQQQPRTAVPISRVLEIEYTPRDA